MIDQDAFIRFAVVIGVALVLAGLMFLTIELEPSQTYDDVLNLSKLILDKNV